jgi:hypothetical protein
MNTQIKKDSRPGLIAGMALIITAGLLLLQMGFLHVLNIGRGWSLLLIGDWLFANTLTDWVYAQISWPMLLAAAGAAMIFRAIGRREPAHYYHHAT